MAASHTLELRDKILQICGQGRIALCGWNVGELLESLLSYGIDAHTLEFTQPVAGTANADYHGRLKRGAILPTLPWDDDAFDSTVAILGESQFSDDDVPRVLAELRRVSRRNLFLRFERLEGVDATARGRNWWEKACFNAGLRKHPDYYLATGYAELENSPATWEIPLELLPDACAVRFPLEALQAERDLHMDMTRETGSRSDAHIYRYHLAAWHIRTGDVVLDLACGLGYGSYVLKRITRASQVVGIDNSRYAVDYAACSFACPGLSFELGSLPECLASIPDASVDAIVSFETLEHVPNPERILAEFRRILTPGGRLMASVPNDWRKADGRDPNPFHMSVYDADSFRSQLSKFFDLEYFFAQTANRAKRLDNPLVWEVMPRAMTKLPADHDLRVSAEWWLALAAKPVAEGRSTPFIDRVWNDQHRQAAGNALAFGRDYENAWLVRSIVSIGLRTEAPALLAQWADEAAHAPLDSADRGAGLCVRAYQRLNQAVGMNVELMEDIDAYLRAPVTNPNVLRWQVSLGFVAALLTLRAGDRDEAKRYFAKVVQLPAVDYSPTLLNKTVEAAWRLGLMHAADGEVETATHIWLDAARRLCRELVSSFQNPPDHVPPTFVYREIADVAAYISRLFCAADIAALFSDVPRQFWHEVYHDKIALLANYKRWNESYAGHCNWLHHEHEKLRAQLGARVDQVETLLGERQFLQQEMDALDREKGRLVQWSSGLEDQAEALARDKAELQAQAVAMARTLAVYEAKSRTLGWKLKREFRRFAEHVRRVWDRRSNPPADPPQRRAA